ncbi:unnamed protein product [Penicillium camemberti]|uniref:Str. FM013 n=1 Tax=Penicillium camemberti (strain FM 013) TaxID=1429867 RepID=A0A0G4PNJ2_PENC3|nr:unnamed protein product [Penicillium camemberti]
MRLGIYLLTRYDQTGDLNDLQHTVRFLKRAAYATPQDYNDPDVALVSINLASYFSTRYDRTGDLDYLQEVVRLAKTAVDTLPDDHP